MFESVLLNRNVLCKLQEIGKDDDNTWPKCFHLSANDFDIIENIVKLLKPVRSATKTLSSSSARIADVTPTFNAVIDTVRSIDVPLTLRNFENFL